MSLQNSLLHELMHLTDGSFCYFYRLRNPLIAEEQEFHYRSHIASY